MWPCLEGWGSLNFLLEKHQPVAAQDKWLEWENDKEPPGFRSFCDRTQTLTLPPPQFHRWHPCAAPPFEPPSPPRMLVPFLAPKAGCLGDWTHPYPGRGWLSHWAEPSSGAHCKWNPSLGEPLWWLWALTGPAGDNKLPLAFFSFLWWGHEGVDGVSYQNPEGITWWYRGVWRGLGCQQVELKCQPCPCAVWPRASHVTSDGLEMGHISQAVSRTKWGDRNTEFGILPACGAA